MRRGKLSVRAKMSEKMWAHPRPLVRSAGVASAVSRRPRWDFPLVRAGGGRAGNSEYLRTSLSVAGQPRLSGVPSLPFLGGASKVMTYVISVNDVLTTHVPRQAPSRVRSSLVWTGVSSCLGRRRPNTALVPSLRITCVSRICATVIEEHAEPAPTKNPR